MNKPSICAVIVDNDLEAVNKVAPLVDLYEVRLDLIGDGWRELVKRLDKPWLASNRTAGEGGRWRGSEAKRIEELVEAVGLGADIVDIELGTENLTETVKLIKQGAKCLLSYHDLTGTPPLDTMKEIVRRQLAAGADICKLVTTARKFEDNLSVLQLITDFPGARVVSFAMGDLGLISRILCPLVGGDFSYASVVGGKESAPGQLTVRDLNRIYGMLSDGR